MIRLGVIQAGFGNSSTVINMLRIIGAEAFEVSNPDQIADFSHLILPGVGNWSAAIKMLEDGKWTFPIKNAVEAGKPLLGICLGMQLLGLSSAEGDGKGLSLLDFSVVPYSAQQGANVGWQRVSEVTTHKGLLMGRKFYFTHSFCVPRKLSAFEWLESQTPVKFVAGVRHENVWGVQFHPERSSHAGMEFLRGFVSL